MRDPISFDPIDPPESTSFTDAELLLCQGLCPWCAMRASFSPSEEMDGSFVCRSCGVELFGPQEDKPGVMAQRTIEAIYVEGDPAKECAEAATLPAVSARP